MGTTDSMTFKFKLKACPPPFALISPNLVMLEKCTHECHIVSCKQCTMVLNRKKHFNTETVLNSLWLTAWSSHSHQHSQPASWLNHGFYCIWRDCTLNDNLACVKVYLHQMNTWAENEIKIKGSYITLQTWLPLWVFEFQADDDKSSCLLHVGWCSTGRVI